MLWFFKINLSIEGFGRWIWDSWIESSEKASSKEDWICPSIIIVGGVSILLLNWKKE